MVQYWFQAFFGQPYKWGCVSGFQSTVRLSLMNLILMNLNFLEYSMLPLCFEQDGERGRGDSSVGETLALQKLGRE